MGKDFDAIVVGSGIGGLAAAGLLSLLRQQRILVLERHWVAGGQTHEFERPGGFEWDVGVPYVGSLFGGMLAAAASQGTVAGARLVQEAFAARVPPPSAAPSPSPS